MKNLPNVDAWLHRTGDRKGVVDDNALDRIADVVLDGMSAAGRDKLCVVEKITVLRKVTAMLLAGLLEDGERIASATSTAGLRDEGEAALAGYCSRIGDALVAEVRSFRRALAKDQRPAA